MFLQKVSELLICSLLFALCVMNTWVVTVSKRVNLQRKQSFHFISPRTHRSKYVVKKKIFFFNKRKLSVSQCNEENNMDTIFKYTKYGETNDNKYINILEKKANEIKNSKNSFNNYKMKNNKYEEEQNCSYQPLDYTTLHVLSFELNALLQDCVVHHITQADDKTIVLHLNKREKEYYLYICYDNQNPVISLGLKIKKLFNRFIDDDYAQKLNPVLKYSIISNIYMKKSFIKILCIDFILKRKTQEDIDIEDILSNTSISRKVTLLFDLHHNSCISFVINKVNNEILISPHNYITEKTIDKSFKEGHTYIFPTNDECKIIPNHYEFFSSFLKLFKSRKEQNFISSILDLYEGLSYNILLKFFDHLNISSDIKFSDIDPGLLLDFFNNTYIKWIRFLNLKEKCDTLIFYPHFDHTLNIYCVVKFLTRKTNYAFLNTPEHKYHSAETRRFLTASVTADITGTEVKQSFADQTVNKSGKDEGAYDYRKEMSKEGYGKDGEEESGMMDIKIESGKMDEAKIESGKMDDAKIESSKLADTKNRETYFETVIELVYYYYGKSLSVNKFYSTLKYCKEFIKKKIPLYEEMLMQYKSEREICEKAYLLHENLNKLSVFNHTISKMKDWIDKKTFDALKLIENELKFNSIEDNRKKYVKRMEEKKQKEELLQKKILNVQPNVIKTSQNLYKGSLLIKVNETDLSSPFIIVGRNSKQNERISTQILKFNDLWFHVHEHPGGHVILRNKKINGKIITADLNVEDINVDDDIKYAANIAAYFSKARKLDKTLVCFTIGKYVLKDNTLSEGAVEVLRYKLVYGRPSKVSSVIKDLKERNKEIELSNKKK
ncbi:FbpA domain protein [Plasmodium brasilianum]|nr:FbpA domain protein [Plasmodium brasilianum]